MEKSRSREKIFADMHRELRAWNPEVPASPDRLDPILRILMQLYAHQLERIDRRIDNVWEIVTASLIRSLCPESMRWPVPAFTVMRCEPVDPVVEVDPHTKFFYKESREGGQTFFFSALKKEKLIAAQVKHIFLKTDDKIIDLSPVPEEELHSTSQQRATFAAGSSYQVYIAVDHTGSATDFIDATLFITGIPDVLRQLRWARWYPGSHYGSFYEDSGFCPGLTTSLDDIFSVDGNVLEWGGLRSGADLFRPLNDNFVVIPREFASTCEMGPIEEKLADQLAANGIEFPSDTGHFYWIRLDLPTGGDKSRLQSPFGIYFNCFVAVNKNDLTLFKHTGGNQLVDVELPEDINGVLEVTSVVDSSGRDYIPTHLAVQDLSGRYYSFEERDNKLVLWFDFSSHLELPPDSLTINYSITAGTDGNGIEAGKINELYESHPGISSAVSIIPTAGAIPAKTDEQIMTEVSARLRNRDRALSFTEISRWALTFDPRIKQAECKNGVERFSGGVRRCIIVRTTIKNNDFYSDDEIKLLQARLGSFLKSRSQVNTHYKVEIVNQ